MLQNRTHLNGISAILEQSKNFSCSRVQNNPLSSGHAHDDDLAVRGKAGGLSLVLESMFNVKH